MKAAMSAWLFPSAVMDLAAGIVLRRWWIGLWAATAGPWLQTWVLAEEFIVPYQGGEVSV